MGTVLMLLNLLACAVLLAAALYFYLRHDTPAEAVHHYTQVALVCVAVGAFGGVMSALREPPPPWWAVAMRLGMAMLAAGVLLDVVRERRPRR